MNIIKKYLIISFISILSSISFAQEVAIKDKKKIQVIELSSKEFSLERGFYFLTSLGGGTAFSYTGKLPRFQPFLDIKVGYDFNNFISVQGGISSIFVSNSPPSSSDDPNVNLNGQWVKDYQMFNTSIETVLSYRPFEQMAMEPKIGIGHTFITPTLTEIGGTEPQTKKNYHLSTGVSLNYLTLLTGFNFGFSVNIYYVFTNNILALAPGVHLRYTFD